MVASLSRGAICGTGDHLRHLHLSPMCLIVLMADAVATWRAEICEVEETFALISEILGLTGFGHESGQCHVTTPCVGRRRGLGAKLIQVALEARCSYSVPTDPRSGGGFRKQEFACASIDSARSLRSESRGELLQSCRKDICPRFRSSHRSWFKYTVSFLIEWMTSVERAGQTSVQPCLHDHACLEADVAAKKALVIIA